MATPDPAADVARALAAGDAPTARRLVADLPADREARDAVLDACARAAAAGSSLALELLAQAVDDSGLARSAVRRSLVDETAVDDVVQDTVVSMATSIGGYRSEARFSTWLHQIARRRVADHLRRRRAETLLSDPDDLGPAMRISSVIASRVAVRRLLDRLPQAYRDAVLLRDVQRLTYAEAAERLDRNVNTVKSHVARGRALLARMLEGGHVD